MDFDWRTYLRSELRRGRETGCFPSAAAAIGVKGEVLATAFTGEAPLPGGAPVDEGTLYDMASLSKVLAPTMIALRALQEGTLGLDETVGKILHVFDDISAIDLPLMITALRTAERGLSNCTIAKSTHALLATDVIDRMFRPEFGETQIAVPKDLLDKLENKETEGKT